MPKIVDAEERREELASAAIDVISTYGIEGAKLRDVANAAGWTTGVVSHYFSDKRELLIFTFQSSVDRRRAMLQRALEDGNGDARPALEGLRILLEGVLPIDEPMRKNWLVWMAFWGQAVSDPELIAIQMRTHRRFKSVIESMLERARAAGELGPHVDAEAAAEQLVALADGIGLQAIFDPNRWTEAHLREVVDRILRDLAAGAKPQRVRKRA